MVFSSHCATADVLADALGRDERFWATARELPEEYPWFTVLLSQILPLLGTASIEYLSTRVEPQETAVTASIAIFTETLLITSAVTVQDSAEPELDTRAVSRSSLIEIQSSGIDSVRTSWPSAYTVTLHYANNETVTLPLGRDITRQSRSIIDFLPTLLADLSAWDIVTQNGTPAQSTSRAHQPSPERSRDRRRLGERTVAR